MAWREHLMAVADVVLRIPPLFIMDSVLNGSFFVTEVFSMNLPMFTCVTAIAFLAALLLFCLSSQQLMDVYNFLCSTIILCISAWWNLRYLVESKTPSVVEDRWIVWNTVTAMTSRAANTIQDQTCSFGVNFAVQITLALIFILLRTQGPLFKMMQNSRVGVSMLQGSVYISLTLPIICGTDIGLSWQLPLLAVGLPSVYMLVELNLFWPHILNSLSEGYSLASNAIRTYGVTVFIETQWIRLHVPVVLQTFWLTRVTYHLVFYYWLELHEAYLNTGQTDYLSSTVWMAVTKRILIRGCETMIAVLGLTSLVSYLAHYIGIFMAFCICSNNEEDKNMGFVSAILFFILALQTGLTSLEPEKRLIRLYRNFCLLFTALLHFVHSMVNPLLLSLSASRNQTISRHVRVLTMCVFLVLFPAWLLVYLWSENSVSTWLLAVTAFSVEVMIKVAFSLMVYVLFMIDAYRDGFWEKLDDYVYYVKSAGSTIEFLFGIFLFCNGGWIMVFEAGGTIRAVMMCIHAYFNIWLQAKKGWQIFMKRRTAVQKINSLPLATSKQLEEVNDICAICYSELNAARITRCHHYFHGVCLRKWLYVQDRCPLCHELIYAQEQKGPDKGVESVLEQNQNDNVAVDRANHNVELVGENQNEEVDEEDYDEYRGIADDLENIGGGHNENQTREVTNDEEEWAENEYNDEYLVTEAKKQTQHYQNLFHSGLSSYGEIPEQADNQTSSLSPRDTVLEEANVLDFSWQSMFEREENLETGSNPTNSHSEVDINGTSELLCASRSTQDS